MKKKIVILGSTGSVGQQTLEVAKQHLNEFEVVGLSGWENTKLLQEQISFYKPKIAVVKNEIIARDLKKNINKQSKWPDLKVVKQRRDVGREGKPRNIENPRITENPGNNILIK